MTRTVAMPRGDPTEVRRVPESEARMIDAIAKKLGLSFGETLKRIAGRDIAKLYRRLKAGEHLELGEAGA